MNLNFLCPEKTHNASKKLNQLNLIQPKSWWFKVFEHNIGFIIYYIFFIDELIKKRIIHWWKY